MNYIYASAAESRNYGDWIIEYASREMLSTYFPEPAAVQDMFSKNLLPGEYDFMIIPGVTMLTPDARPFLSCLKDASYPIYCLAGNYWVQSLPKSGFLFKNSVRMKGNDVVGDLSVVEQLQQPVGVRDPFTARLLQSNGVGVKFTGCPTIHMSDEGCGDDGYVLFSFGRGNEYAQVRAAHGLAKKHHVVCICHEPLDFDRFKAAGLKLPLIDFEGDIELYLSYFKRASVVVSGRLHGVLPSIAFKKPVFYYGTNDSRTTLLEVLGVKIHRYKDIKYSVDRAAQLPNRAVIAYFRKQWDEMLQSIKSNHDDKK